jgi:uncharacterized membrane protein
MRLNPARAVRHLRRWPRLSLATLLAIALYFLLPAWLRVETRLLLAFDIAAAAFIAAIWIMMVEATPASLRRRARIEDEGRFTVLTSSATVALAVLLAVVFQLHNVKDSAPGQAALHVALAITTILLSWLFMNTMFALHYAHGYYGDDDAPGDEIAGGLAFPGKRPPDYWDFLYFSFVIGMTFQVSDVQIESHGLRRVALAHGALAFFFNVVILALTINIVAGLI